MTYPLTARRPRRAFLPVVLPLLLVALTAAGSSPMAADETSLFVTAADPPGEGFRSVSAELAYGGALAVNTNNRRYFMIGDSCNTVYLAGTSHRNNVQDVGTTYPPPSFNFAGLYPPSDAPNANFIRGWHWEHSRWQRDSGVNDWILPLPFSRPGPGTANDGRPRFNLTTYDGSYVTRLQNRAATANSDGMYLSLMLFQGFSVQSLDQGEYPWPNHPFRNDPGVAVNNLNGIDGDWTASYPNGGELHSQIAGKTAAVISAQDNYVRHMVASLNGYKNILWEVSNESHSGSLGWQNYVAGVIRNHETTLPNKHLVWISHPQGVTNVALHGSAGDVVSPSVNEPAVRAYGGTGAGTLYQTDPPVTAGSKIVVLDTDHLKPKCDWCGQAWPWKAFTRGYHVMMLDDVPDNATKRAAMRKAINQTQIYADKVQLVHMAPQDERFTTPCSTRYCLYSSGNPDPQPYAPATADGLEFLVFKLSPTANVTLAALPAGKYAGEWLRVSNGAVSTIPEFDFAGGNYTAAPPTAWGTEDAVLWFRRTNMMRLCL